MISAGRKTARFPTVHLKLNDIFDMEKYSRGRRGAPAKGVGR